MTIKTVIMPIFVSEDRNSGFISNENVDSLLQELSHTEVVFYYIGQNIIGKIILIDDSNLGLLACEDHHELIPADALKRDLKSLENKGTHVILERSRNRIKGSGYIFCDATMEKLTISYTTQKAPSEDSSDTNDDSYELEFQIGDLEFKVEELKEGA